MYFYKNKTYLNNGLLEQCNSLSHSSSVEKNMNLPHALLYLSKFSPSTVTISIFLLSVKYIVLLYVLIPNLIFQLIGMLLPFSRLNNFNSLVTLQFSEKYKFDIISIRQ